jgi:hypothetical protein
MCSKMVVVQEGNKGEGNDGKSHIIKNNNNNNNC